VSSGRKEFLKLLHERAQKFYSRQGPSRFEIKEGLETLLAILEESLIKGERISISGFGTFLVRLEKPRKGRDFRTGEVREVSPRKRPVFRPSRKLLEFLNS